MESGLRSRKRKQRPSKSDQLVGVFTRSKSQIYLHRHRSGYSRADSVRSRNIISSLVGTTTSPVKQEKSEATVSQLANQVSVKDLRARRVFSPTTITDDVISTGEVDLESGFDVHKKNDGKSNVSSSEGDLGISDSVADDPKANSENVVDPSSAAENDVMEADGFVTTTPIVPDSDQNKGDAEKNVMISVANEIAVTKDSISKSQSSVTSLRGRRKVFKSPSSFSYRRLLPFLKDLGNDDSSSFEIVETKQVEKPINKAKSCEEHFLNNPDSVKTVESGDVMQKSQDILNDTLEVTEQMTPPDSDIYSKSKTDKIAVKPTSNVLNPCSRMKALQIPTCFSHRRLLPFLMSVSGENSSASKGNQLLKPEKVNQQLPTITPSLLHGKMDTDTVEPETNSNSGEPSTANEKSNSPTSTLTPIDTSFDTLTSILTDNVHSESSIISQSLEQSPPENNLKCVEEAAETTLPIICTEQSIVANNDHTEDSENPVNKNTQQCLMQITPNANASGMNGILKRTPRGCRGICNCLNCTSFRLHAERSFEFSRNQMHDAEDLALELINDLASLRNIFQTTATDTKKQKQVKEACEKALYKEQVARARLAQLNEDYCRSMNLRPKVTFGNKIEERVISNTVVNGNKSV